MSFLAGWATMLSYTVTISISAFAVSGYLSVFFDELGYFPGNVIFTLTVIGGLAVLNTVGVREATSISVVFTVMDLVTQVLLVIVGAITLLNLPLLFSQVQFGVAPTWGNFIYGISIGMVAYTGIETISNMVEEARSPERAVPRSYGLLVGSVLVLFLGISIVGLSAMPVYMLPTGEYTTDLAREYIDDPVAGIAERLPEPFNHVFKPLVAGLASTILLIAANAGIIGVSRLSFSMGAHQQLPSFLRKVHPRFRTPHIAVGLFSIIAALIVLPGNLGDISDVYVFGAMLTFTLAHFSVIAMRFREPNRVRPFRLPLNLRIGGADVPVTAIIGGLGTLAVWVIVVVSRPFGRWVGLAWMVSGIVIYVWYRRRNGLPLNRAAPPPTRPSPPPLSVESPPTRAVRTR